MCFFCDAECMRSWMLWVTVILWSPPWRRQIRCRNICRCCKIYIISNCSAFVCLTISYNRIHGTYNIKKKNQPNIIEPKMRGRKLGSDVFGCGIKAKTCNTRPSCICLYNFVAYRKLNFVIPQILWSEIAVMDCHSMLHICLFSFWYSTCKVYCSLALVSCSERGLWLECTLFSCDFSGLFC